MGESLVFGYGVCWLFNIYLFNSFFVGNIYMYIVCMLKVGEIS